MNTDINLKEKNFIRTILERSISNYNLQSRRIYNLNDEDRNTFCTRHYDFDYLKKALEAISGVESIKILKYLFEIFTSSCQRSDHTGKWLSYLNFISTVMRHATPCQPMWPDGNIVSHPLILLWLGEGRCGHVARLTVDFASANGYEARMVQVAAHVVAEVKWDNEWHMIDAGAHADFSRSEILANLPSIEKLAAQPWVLDTIPCRNGGGLKDYRTSDGALATSIKSTYPAPIKLSSAFFGRQVYQNLFSGDPGKPRKGVLNCYKRPYSPEDDIDIHYGWQFVKWEETPVPMIDVEFRINSPEMFCPAVVYSSCGSGFKVPVRIFPLMQVVYDHGSTYRLKQLTDFEVRVSSHTRGWDYDFRNYACMPELGKGDILKISSLNDYSGMLGLDLDISPDIAEIFIETRCVPQPHFSGIVPFTWPSKEYYVRLLHI